MSSVVIVALSLRSAATGAVVGDGDTCLLTLLRLAALLVEVRRRSTVVAAESLVDFLISMSFEFS